MIALPELSLLLPVIVLTGVLVGLLWSVPPWIARHTGWTAAHQKTFASLFRGPSLALVLAFAAVEFDRQFWHANPGLSPVFSPASVAVVGELAVIWTLVGAATLAIRRHLVGPHAASSRFLQYGTYGAGLLGVIVVLLLSPAVPRLTGGIWATIAFVSGLLITYLAVHTVNILADRYFTALVRRQPGLMTVYRFLRRALLLLVILVGVAVSAYASFPGAAAAVTSLLLAAGFLSIVLGLAAQSTFSNIIAGAMISLSQPFKIGDAIVFPYPNGDWCFVEDIRLTFTVLRAWDLRRLMVPNSMFTSGVLINYTAVDPTKFVIVYMVVSYDADVDRARALMVEEARNHPDFKPLGNLPVTHVMDYQGGANRGSGMYGGVDIRLLSAARDQSTAFEVEKALLDSIRKRFRAEGIELAYPTQRVIVESPPRGRPNEPSRRRPVTDG